MKASAVPLIGLDAAAALLNAALDIVWQTGHFEASATMFTDVNAVPAKVLCFTIGRTRGAMTVDDAAEFARVLEAASRKDAPNRWMAQVTNLLAKFISNSVRAAEGASVYGPH